MPYDVVKRMQEVAKRAKETGPIVNAAPKKKKPEVNPEDDAEAYRTRPGAMKGPNSGKDVNLPIQGASPEVKKRLGMK